jgi:hypothetical protein
MTHHGRDPRYGPPDPSPSRTRRDNANRLNSADDLIEIFLEGAAAAVANHGVSQWNNPHLPGLVAAQKRGEDTEQAREKIEAWEKGWEWRVKRMSDGEVNNKIALP